ncbi:hypothetical protein ACVSZJ_003472, partial [Vibrio cholerae]
SNFEDSNRHMERKRQIEWLKIQKKGFFRHFLGCGLGFSIPVILSGAFVQNDFYLDLSPIVSYRVYLMTLFGAAFLLVVTGFSKVESTKNTKKNYCGKITHNKRLKRDCQRVAFPVQ